jgi:hypothetical protein
MLAAERRGVGLVLWDAAIGREIRRLSVTPPSSANRGFDFSPDGKILAAVDGPSNSIRCWEAATGKEVRNLRSAHSLTTLPVILRFAPDGRRLAVIVVAEDPKAPGQGLQQIDVRSNPQLGQLHLPQELLDTYFPGFAVVLGSDLHINLSRAGLDPYTPHPRMARRRYGSASSANQPRGGSRRATPNSSATAAANSGSP